MIEKFPKHANKYIKIIDSSRVYKVFEFTDRFAKFDIYIAKI